VLILRELRIDERSDMCEKAQQALEARDVNVGSRQQPRIRKGLDWREGFGTHP